MVKRVICSSAKDNSVITLNDGQPYTVFNVDLKNTALQLLFYKDIRKLYAKPTFQCRIILLIL